MKCFFGIILFVAISLCAKEALASSAEFYRDTIDFGTISVQVPTNQASATMSRSSPYTITGSNATTDPTGQFAAVRVTNTTSSGGIVEKVSVGTTTLSCVSSCDSDGAQCSISFTPSYVSSYSVPKNGRSTYPITGTVNIPANCGTGVFEGGATWKGSNFVSATLTITVRAYLSVPVPRLNVSKTQDMNFGTISTTSAHNVTINPNGCTVSSTVPSGLISSSSARCGVFTLQNATSSAQAVSSVTLPSSITLSGSNGGSFTLDITSYPAVNSITSVPGNTTTTVNVGGTLHVSGGEPAGTYTGTYTITVNY